MPNMVLTYRLENESVGLLSLHSQIYLLRGEQSTDLGTRHVFGNAQPNHIPNHPLTDVILRDLRRTMGSERSLIRSSARSSLEIVIDKGNKIPALVTQDLVSFLGSL